MKKEILLYIAVFAPVAGAFILPILGSFSKSLRNLIALALVSISFVSSAIMAKSVIEGEIITAVFNIMPGFNFILQADMLAVFMALTSSFIGSIIVLY